MEDRSYLLRPGRVVKHFKRDFMSKEEKLNNLKYLYVVAGVAEHTETGEKLVVYRSLGNEDLYVRPVDMFLSEVDKEKYPEAKARYRFEWS